MKHILTLAAFLVATTPAAAVHANEIVIGIGRSGFSTDNAGNLLFGSLDYHAAPFASHAGFDFGLGAGGLWDGNGDYFLGAGLVVTRRFGNGRWFVELSEMPGYYHADNGEHDLGNDLEFRSQLALGYRLDSIWSVSLAGAHISNASLSDENPGVNFGFLRLHRSLGGR